MDARKELEDYSGTHKGLRKSSSVSSLATYALLLMGSLVVSYLIVERIGSNLFLMAVIGIFFGTIYAVVSFGNLMIPLLVWILSVGGFRFLWSIRAPGLPDLFLDRMSMIWLVVVFFIKFFAEKKKLKGPYLLDLLMLMNALYIVILIFVIDMNSFHDWTMSYLIPYFAYFVSKNIITTRRQIHLFLGALMALVVYYNITSVAEKLDIHALVWPKYILETEMFRGRSIGPFQHAPLFGTVIGMMIPIYFYFIEVFRNKWAKILLYASLLTGFAGLYFTYTRGSWLAGIMALVVTGVLNRKSYGKVMLPALVVAPIVAVMFLGIGQDKFMRERVENEDTLGSRFGTFVTATKVWRANPIFGVGINQYRRIIDDYVEPLDLPVIGVITVSQFRNNPPHDIYIAYLAETGIVGVTLQGLIYLMIFKVFLQKYRWRKRGSHFAIYILPVFGGVFAGYLFGGLAINYLFFSVVGTLFYSCAGILYGYRGEDEVVADLNAAEQGGRVADQRYPNPLSHPSKQAD